MALALLPCGLCPQARPMGHAHVLSLGPGPLAMRRSFVQSAPELYELQLLATLE